MNLITESLGPFFYIENLMIWFQHININISISINIIVFKNLILSNVTYGYSVKFNLKLNDPQPHSYHNSLLQEVIFNEIKLIGGRHASIVSWFSDYSLILKKFHFTGCLEKNNSLIFCLITLP